MKTRDIFPFFQYAPHYVEVVGSQIHYVDEGLGHPVLFLHGNPTSSYLWRNIIPYVTPVARCIAPDLIGMGKSDKPSIPYRFVDHVRYVEGFIHKLGLRNITLVLHDWGSAIGFHYAMRNEDNVKGLAFMEAIVKPFTWKEFPKEFRIGFRLFRAPFIGWFLIMGLNMYVEKVMPRAIVRDLTDEEKNHYRKPFIRTHDRKPVRQWPREIPIAGTPEDVHQRVLEYSEKLQRSHLPKILFHGSPGGIMDEKMVEWCVKNLPNLRTVNIGSGIHYLQEDNPHLIGQMLADWYKQL